MQKHERPGDPGHKGPKRSTSWWLMLIICGLLGLIVAQLLQRWL
jgi:hypothetical protein